MIKDFMQSKEALLKKLDSVVFYMDTFSSNYTEIVERRLLNFAYLLNELADRSESISDNTNMNTDFVKSILKEGGDFKDYEDMVLDESNKINASFSRMGDEIQHSINEMNSFLEPQEALPIYAIQNTSIFVYIFSIYESFLNGDSDELVYKTINVYKNDNFNSDEWKRWARKAHKFRDIRNTLVHKDVGLKVTRKNIHELIDNIKDFLNLYSMKYVP
ncbi:hypothetical protein [Gorillibacterium timonense]|uniref:hypothetical protein n=1 Tax=Gorillibacterium timonense TaxID=1689269 RepID=UPI00071C96E8|nr:hypothetical protein [Gorillibacterium timonense]